MHTCLLLVSKNVSHGLNKRTAATDYTATGPECAPTVGPHSSSVIVNIVGIISMHLDSLSPLLLGYST